MNGDDGTPNLAWDVVEVSTVRHHAEPLGGGDGGAESTEFDTLDPLTSHGSRGVGDSPADGAASPGVGDGGGAAAAAPAAVNAVPLAEVARFARGTP